jgi:iron(III) transport system ATP-binding protein
MAGGLTCEAVAKAYGPRPVLAGVDLVVPGGTLTAILGASGSGKTTLLRVIMGFVEADAGSVTVGVKVVADAGHVHLAPDKRAIGYVAQEGALFPHLTAGENVGFGLPRPQRRRGDRIIEVLELVGLDGSYAPRRPHELSGGEQRRVALARALAPRPPLVLLDEPFSGLDAALRGETRAAVLHALAREGTTALLVTHDQAEALSMGTQVAVLRDGRLVQSAAPAGLYRAPIDAELAQFVGDAVLLTGSAAAGRVSCALGQLPIRGHRLDGEVQVMVRPEQIQMRRFEGGRAVPGPTATVVDHTYHGPDTVIALRLDRDDADSVVKARTLRRDVPDLGERVELEVLGDVVVYPRPPTGGVQRATIAGPASS